MDLNQLKLKFLILIALAKQMQSLIGTKNNELKSTMQSSFETIKEMNEEIEKIKRSLINSKKGLIGIKKKMLKIY